jgi:hypothetical protein
MLSVALDQVLDRQVRSARVLRVRERRAGRHVQGVDARLDEPLADLDRVLERVARRSDVQRRQRVGVLLRADLHLEVEVVADLGAHGLDDVEHETGAVLERAAVFVLAVVDGRAQELRDQ